MCCVIFNNDILSDVDIGTNLFYFDEKKAEKNPC